MTGNCMVSKETLVPVLRARVKQRLPVIALRLTAGKFVRKASLHALSVATDQPSFTRQGWSDFFLKEG